MLYFFIYFLFIILTLLILKKYNGNTGKKKNTKCHIFIFNFSSVTTIYLHNSNYWVGDNVLKKV